MSYLTRLVPSRSASLTLHGALPISGPVHLPRAVREQPAAPGLPPAPRGGQLFPHHLRPSPQDELGANTQPEQQQEQDPFMSRQKALIVDDEPDIRELLEITLGRMKLDTRSARSLKEARDCLTRERIDLCLTDMRLPDG